MPRYRERFQRDVHVRFDHVPHAGPYQPPHGSPIAGGAYRPLEQTGDFHLVITDIRASRHDVLLSLRVGAKERVLEVTGPWLTESRSDTGIYHMMSIIGDAQKEGRTIDALELVKQMVTTYRSNLLRVAIVPPRQNWGVRAYTNEGAEPGPLDVYIRTLVTRDVA